MSNIVTSYIVKNFKYETSYIQEKRQNHIERAIFVKLVQKVN